MSFTTQGKVTFISGVITMECNYTFTGAFESGLVAVVRGALLRLGTITRVTWSECSSGVWETVLNLPWNVALTTVLEAPRACTRAHMPGEAAYNTACGALITILGFAIQLARLGGIERCLWGGPSETLGALLPLTRTAGNEREATYSMGLMTLLPNTLRLASGFDCPTSGEMRGRFAEPSPRQSLTLLA